MTETFVTRQRPRPRPFTLDQDRDQDPCYETKTKTKTKTSVYVLEEPRDQDHGLEDYNTDQGHYGFVQLMAWWRSMRIHRAIETHKIV